MSKNVKPDKISRNSPCPCGSGKKHKRCCLQGNAGPQIEQRLATPREIEIMRKMNAASMNFEREKVKRFGHVRDIVHFEFQGQKMVAVGNHVHFSMKWKMFTDFLVDYAKCVLGMEWGQTEIEKPIAKRHQIVRWYSNAMTHMNSSSYEKMDGIKSCEMDGCTAAYFRLSYDLYTIRNHAQLQNRVIDRLKNNEQFQGARHELFTAATLIRAGFEIDYENEDDRTQKHPEFFAVHNRTKEIISS